MIVRLCGARLQELCANPTVSKEQAQEIADISKTIVRESSKILVWAERVVK